MALPLIGGGAVPEMQVIKMRQRLRVLCGEEAQMYSARVYLKEVGASQETATTPKQTNKDLSWIKVHLPRTVTHQKI
jgi:hypothetical protein